ETQGFALYEIQLPEHDERGDNQAHRGGELNNQKGFAQQPSPTLVPGKITVEGRHRFKGRDKESRIKTSQQPCEQKDGHEAKPERGVFQEVVESKMFVGKVVECR